MRTRPFSISPNPDLLYLTSALEQTVFKVQHVVENRQGLTAIMGDVGTGKSSLLRYLYDRYNDDPKYAAIILPSPNFPSDFAMLKAICGDYGLARRRSMLEQENELRNFLADADEKDQSCVLFIDEAQRLKGPHLELIRTLLNFETNEYKLIQIVLAAQLELRQKLMDTSKKALRSRIYLPSLLAPLSLPETEAMIAFRCERSKIPNPFSPEATKAIYTRTNGVPRDILKVCDFAYVMALQMGEMMVPLDLIDVAVNEASLEEHNERATEVA